MPRLARRIDLAPLLAGIAGVVLLAICRPYEGALTVVSSSGVLLLWMRREKRPLTSLFNRRVLLPVAAVAVLSVLAMGDYNYVTTGKATELPYVLNDKTYAASPRFYFQAPTPFPVYHHETLRKLWTEWDRQIYLNARKNPLSPLIWSAEFMVPFYFNLLGLAAVAGVLFGKRAVILPALRILILPLLGVMLEKAFVPHYLAPVCGAWIILAAIGMEVCGKWRRAGRVVVLAVLVIALGTCITEIADQARTARKAPTAAIFSSCCRVPDLSSRELSALVLR